jgi:acetyl esterase/lipase
MLAGLAPLGMDRRGEPLPLTAASPREQLLEFAFLAEQGFDAGIAALVSGLPPVEGVGVETRVIPGSDGNDIQIYIHAPAERTGPLPCAVHFHGGGMVILTAADPGYVRLRSELAATGMVVVGVEFRNGGGKLGAHPFPAGLNDCVSALRWTADRKADLGISSILVCGESGGGNLTLAVTHAAKRDGLLGLVDGAYAMCPYISNAWDSKPANLVSLHENDGYFISCEMMSIMARIYDPFGENASDPTCWPSRATIEDLSGMPPHVISVNELDPLRDEGLAYFRKLAAAGVRVYSRTVNGTCHGGDVLLPGQMPEVYGATIRDIRGFADSLSR